MQRISPTMRTLIAPGIAPGTAPGTAVLAAIAIAALSGTTASAQSVGGRYRAQGTNFDGSSYSGTAVITRSSNTTCRIEWKTGGSSSSGFCMLAKGSLAAAYKLGNSVGLVLYELEPDGTLRGIWTIADEAGAGTEILTPVP
jgi:hypothetical protein